MSGEKRQTPDGILADKIAKLQHRREWKKMILECVVLAAAIYIIFHYVLGIAYVSGSSMEPTLKDGELVLFYRLDQEYRTGDIVIIHRGDDLEYIKRIVATAGEEVDLQEGVVLVNGEKEKSGYVSDDTNPLSDKIEFPYTVPEKSCFVLGDNRTNSRDSRSFGSVTYGEITGRVFLHIGIMK
jgi:signal peptidase I